MQMTLLAFAVIAIRAAHIEWYNGSSFKLQGWKGSEKH